MSGDLLMFKANTGMSPKQWVINYGRTYLKNHPDQTAEDALVCALEELDDGWGIHIDPTREEYTELQNEIRRATS